MGLSILCSSWSCRISRFRGETIQRAAAGWNVPKDLNRGEKMYRFMSTHNRWVMIILVLVLVSATAVQMVSAETAHVANHVVISEICIGGTDDWIELYNPTNGSINLSDGYRIEKASSSGGDPAVLLIYGSNSYSATYPGGTVIPAHGFYLHVRNAASDSLKSKADALSDFSLTDDNVIYLATDTIGVPANSHNDDPDIVDYVGYGSALQYEGSGQAPAPPDGGSIERKAINSSTPTSMAPGGDHHTWGNGEDTNNNSADFITKTSPEPQNSSRATEDSPSQSWFLSNTSGSNYIMYKGDMSKIEGTVTVSDGSSTIWGANEPAAVDVGFPAGTWTGKITLSESFASDETFTVEVGSYEGSTFTSAGSQTCTGAADKTTFSLEIPATAFDISNGNYLALNITNPPDGSADLVIKTGGGNSYVTSPSTDPAYPVPELSTLILFSTGLLILAGYAYMTRRNR